VSAELLLSEDPSAGGWAGMFVAVLIEDVLFVSFVSGPTDVLRFNVASGCNKELCTPEIEKF
jgi:hypothetical protein